MIKKLFFLTVLSVYFLYVNAQEYEYVSFPDSGAIWSEVYYPSISDGERISYERFALSGQDTVINTKTYKKLYLFYDTVFRKDNAICIGGIREDGLKKVYFIGDSALHEFKPFDVVFHAGEELLLYDFSLNVGDTIRQGNFDWLIVQKIDTMAIGNTYRKIFHFENIWWVKWIEGIGNIKGLLFTSDALPTNGTDGDLICFKQNNTILYFNDYYDQCMPLIGGNKVIEKDISSINTYPNPVTNGFIHFELGEIQPENIEIYDCLGHIVDCIHCARESSIIHSTEKYPPGIYFYLVTNQEGKKYKGKFVTQ